MSYARLHMDQQILLNPVERFREGEYEIIRKEDVTIIAKPGTQDLEPLFDQMINHHIMQSGSFNLSPFSFNWNHHSQIFSIIKAFKRKSNHVSLSSCRVDSIARDPYLAKMIRDFGATNITVAVEGISDKMRNFFHKTLTEEEMLAGLHHVIESGFRSMKMYFIYTGVENDEDIEEFDAFISKLDELRNKLGKPTFPIRTSFTPLNSTLGTSLQYHGSQVSKSLKAGGSALYRIKQICSRNGIGFRISVDMDGADVAQMLEFADRRSQGMIEYSSFCGLAQFPNLGVFVAENPIEITKKQYDAMCSKEVFASGDKFYKSQKYSRFTLNKLYELMYQHLLYKEKSPSEFYMMIKNLQGKQVPEEWYSLLPKGRIPEGAFIFTNESPPMDLICKYPNGKPQFSFLVETSASPFHGEALKRLYPMATNGQTFNDDCWDKDGLTIFPSWSVRDHRLRPHGYWFKEYITDQARIYKNYCLGGSQLEACVNCGSCIGGETKITVRWKQEA